MLRFTATPIPAALRALLLLGLALCGWPHAYAADGGAVVSGVVRDAQGIGQMGALVQVLAANSATVGTAFTDAHGRYSIANLNPGRYLVRASATLFVPATRSNLQLRTGAVTVVNLTLAALFDTTAWLPAERRKSDEPDDDWKWALRSSANRPILRILEDGQVIEVSTSATESTPSGSRTHARETVASGDGQFGAGGVHNILAFHRLLDTGGDLVVRSDVGTSRVPTASAGSLELETGFEQRQGFDGAERTVVSYKSHPELIATGAPNGVQVMTLTSGRRMSFGEVVEVEAGGRMQAVNAGATAIQAHPFLRVTTHPMGVWTLHYRMATERGVQGFEGVTTGESEIPVALVTNGRLLLESGRHQEASLDRRAGQGTVSMAFYHDTATRTSISGGGQGQLAAGMLTDPTTGTFRALAGGYTSNGMRMTASTPLMQGLWVAAEYSTGSAMASESGQLAQFDEAVSSLRPELAETATLALKGRLKASGTRLRASYRWQPSRFVTAIDPYSTFADQAFFSCQLRQPIRWGMRLPSGLDATIDVTNLLAQGYRPFLSADGQTLYFAQTPRAVTGGVSFTF